MQDVVLDIHTNPDNLDEQLNRLANTTIETQWERYGQFLQRLEDRVNCEVAAEFVCASLEQNSDNQQLQAQIVDNNLFEVVKGA